MRLPSLPHLRAPWTPCASTPRTRAGGFQMVSLLHLAQITEEGVTFQSPVDGSSMLLTPEASVTIQNQLGADILMALDDVVSSVADSPARFAEATERTTRWIDRCIAAHARPSEQSLFAIVQVRRRHSAGPPEALPPGGAVRCTSLVTCTATSFGLASVSNPLEPRFEGKLLQRSPVRLRVPPSLSTGGGPVRYVHSCLGGGSRCCTPVACSPGPPEPSKSYSDVASKSLHSQSHSGMPSSASHHHGCTGGVWLCLVHAAHYCIEQRPGHWGAVGPHLSRWQSCPAAASDSCRHGVSVTVWSCSRYAARRTLQ